ncbi:MAG: SpoIIE family protein phosphatase [Candidatus Cloacimonetes bacterium]|nr:SpoIIE family protein phosphatase [Candidatus Cloacimonadota bacterium]
MPTSRSHSLAYQLISFVFVAMLLLFFGSTLLTRLIYKKIILDAQLQNMRHLAHERVHQLDGFMETVSTAAGISLELIYNQGVDHSAFEEHLRSTLISNPGIYSVCYLTHPEKGNKPVVYYYYRGKHHKNIISTDHYRFNDWYQIPTISGKALWIEPWYDIDGRGGQLVSYSLPIYQKGKSIGVLRYDVSLDYLRQLPSTCVVSDNLESFVVSSTGTLITFRDPELVMNHSLFSLAQDYDSDDLYNLGAAMINGEIGNMYISGDSPLGKQWIAYFPLVSNHWSVGVAIHKNDLMDTMRLILWIQVITSVLIFLSVTGIIYGRVVRVNKPLKSLANAAAKIGAGDFDASLPSLGQIHEINELTQSFASMQSSLKDYIQNLRITTEEKDKIRGDVIYASEIQTKLIPKNSEHPFNIKELRAYGILEPAGDIGGDLYDYFVIDENHFCFVIADVLGKGIVAAMSMAMISTFLPSIAPYHIRSSELLSKLNSFLCRNNIEDNFVTIFLGVLNIKTGELEYSNCGHVPLLIRKIDRRLMRYNETHSTALGVFDGITIDSSTIKLDVGDEIILYTDGITEAQNAQEEFLGMKGLEKIIGELRNPNPERNAKYILESVKSFAAGSSHQDDITLLLIDYKRPELMG